MTIGKRKKFGASQNRKWTYTYVYPFYLLEKWLNRKLS